jgi:hypothetical protein
MDIKSTVSTHTTQAVTSAVANKSAGYFDIDEMKKNPLYKAVFTLPDGRQIIGYTEGGFQFQTSAQYQDTASMPSFAEILNQVTGIVANNLQTSQFQAKSIRLSEARWTGCDSPSFTIQINNPVVRSTDNPYEAMEGLLQCTTSTVSNLYKDNTGSSLLAAPNGYYVKYGEGQSSDQPVNAVSIKLGNWFSARSMLVTSVQHTLSEARLYTGDPILYSATIGFQFWRMPTYQDILSWFPNAALRHRATNIAKRK